MLLHAYVYGAAPFAAVAKIASVVPSSIVNPLAWSNVTPNTAAPVLWYPRRSRVLSAAASTAAFENSVQSAALKSVFTPVVTELTRAKLRSCAALLTIPNTSTMFALL